MSPKLLDAHLNDFALRCFRDMADGDYIAARMAFRAEIVSQALWASEQAIEKYLKCLLLLRRIPSHDVAHSPLRALAKLDEEFPIPLSDETRRFIEFIDLYGPDRYLVYPYSAEGMDLARLDQTAWTIRRYCIPYTTGMTPNGAVVADLDIKRILDSDNHPPQTHRTLVPGFLETVLDNRNHAARPYLVWQNGYFGRSVRKTVRIIDYFHSTNSPLALYPEIFQEVAKYVHIPKEAKPPAC